MFKVLLYITLIFSTLLAENGTKIQKDFLDKTFKIQKNLDNSFYISTTVKADQKNRVDGVAFNNGFDYLNSLKQSNSVKTVFFELNKNALLTKTSEITLEGISSIYDSLKTSNGDFIALCNYNLQPSIIKFNSHGIVFQKAIDIDLENSKLLILKDNSIIIASQKKAKINTSDPFTGGSGGSDIALYKLSSNFDIKWSRDVGTPNDDTLVDILLASDDSIVVLANVKYKNYTNFAIFRVDKSGKLLWLENKQENQNTKAHKLLALKDGTFLASLTNYKDRVKLIKFNIDGKSIQTKEIGTTYSTSLYDIKELKNSDLIGVGKVSDKDDTDALVMQLNSELDIVNQEHFGSLSYEVIDSFQVINESNIICTAKIIKNNTKELWIFRLNQELKIY